MGGRIRGRHLIVIPEGDRAARIGIEIVRHDDRDRFIRDPAAVFLKTDEIDRPRGGRVGQARHPIRGTAVTLRRVFGCPSSPVIVVPLGMATVNPGRWAGRTSARWPGVMT